MFLEFQMVFHHPKLAATLSLFVFFRLLTVLPYPPGSARQDYKQAHHQEHALLVFPVLLVVKLIAEAYQETYHLVQ